MPKAISLPIRRQVFSQWGRPKSFRVDNGCPWGSRGVLANRSKNCSSIFAQWTAFNARSIRTETGPAGWKCFRDCIPRRVDRAGLISICNRNYYVGKHHQSAVVSAMLDPVSRKWIILDDQGHELRTHPAEQLTRNRITTSNVTHRRKKPK